MIGSGNLVHNLMALAPAAPAYDWAQAFDADDGQAHRRARCERRRRRARRVARGAARASDARAFSARDVPARRRRREGRIELLQRHPSTWARSRCARSCFRERDGARRRRRPRRADGGGDARAKRAIKVDRRRRRAVARRANSCSPAAAASISPIPSRSRSFPRALRRGARAAAAGDRGLPAGRFARLERRRSASRLSSARAGGCFPRSFKSTPLLRAWLRRLEALGVELAPAPPADRLRARRRGALRDARGEVRRRRTRSCSRSAAPPGRGSAATAAGSRSCAPPGSRSRRCSPPIRAFTSNGRRIFASVSRARR